jgi:alkylhydroperoxidase family enzyme
MSPLKVIYARNPQLLSFAMKIAKFEEKQNTLSLKLRLLIKIATATQNGCTFCQNIALAHAVKGKIGMEKFVALIEKDEAKMQVFSEKERAVLQVLGEYNGQRISFSREFYRTAKTF